MLQKQKISQSLKGKAKTNNHKEKLINHCLEMNDKIKGKTLEEIYGKDRAEKIRSKRSNSMKKVWSEKRAT